MREMMKELLQRLKEDLARAHKSWTMLLNAASAALGSVWLYLLANPDALAQAQVFMPQLEGLLSPKVLTVITLALNMLNMALRIKTSGRLAEK